MTHDELLATINNLFDKGFDAEIKNAVLAVVELHKSEMLKTGGFDFEGNEYYGEQCNQCFVDYPCPTIQAITEQLG